MKYVEIGPRTSPRPDWIIREDALFIELEKSEAAYLQKIYPRAHITSEPVNLALSHLPKDSIEEIFLKDVLGSRDVRVPNRFVSLGNFIFPRPQIFYENYVDVIRLAHACRRVLKPLYGQLMIVETYTPAPKEELISMFTDAHLILKEVKQMSDEGYELRFNK